MTIMRLNPQADDPTAERDRVRFPDGREVTVTAEAADMLARVAGALAAGRAVTVVADDEELTSSQAASLLGISRPTLYKLLDEEVMPHTVVGNQRRVPASAVVAYMRLREHTPLRAPEFAKAHQALVAAGVTEHTLEAATDTEPDSRAVEQADRALEAALAAEGDEAAE